MRLTLFFLLSLFMFTATHAAVNLDITTLENELKKVENNKELPNQTDILDAYQKAIYWLNEQKKSTTQSAQYQTIINNYRQLSTELEQSQQQLLKELDQKLQAIPKTSLSDDPNARVTTIADLEQTILQTNSKLLDISRQLQQEQDRLREIGESLIQLPEQQAQASKALNNAEMKLLSQESNSKGMLGQALLAEHQAEVTYRKSQVNELALKQLSAYNRQGLSQKKTEGLKNTYSKTESYLQTLRNQLNEYRLLRQQEAELLANELIKQNSDLPEALKDHLKDNQVLSKSLQLLSHKTDTVSREQQQIANDILTVRKTLNTLREQAQWLNMSTMLGEIQRAQIAKLPNLPKLQQFDNQMAELRVEQLSFETDIKQFNIFQDLFNRFKESVDDYETLKKSYNALTERDFNRLSIDKQLQLNDRLDNALTQQQKLLAELSPEDASDDKLFTSEQIKLIQQQINSRGELLNALHSGTEMLIVEITQLKVLNSQLKDALEEIREAAHRYLFWVADVKPLSLHYPLDVIQDLTRLLSLDTLSQLSGALESMITSPDSLSFIIGSFLLVIFGISSRRHYHGFLERAATRVGKVTQDKFSLTLKAVLWSLVVALPLPIFLGALSYGLQQAWQYPTAMAIGNGINATLPVMWMFMISASFAHPRGLFIVHLGWSSERVARAMRYYKLTVWVVVPLLMTLIAFDSLNDREFASSLGRLCYFLLCAALVVMTINLHKSGISLYLDDKGSSDNFINELLWRLLRYAPIIAAIAAAFGYLATSQALLARLDISVIIWFSLLVIYYIIRRSMLIQRRRIEFERAKQRRAERLAQRARSEEESGIVSSTSEANMEIEEPVVDLDTISSQSLQLVRSILTLIAFISVIALWSELNSAFAFMENIHLWDVTSTIKGIEDSQPITLGSLLIAILVLIITMQLVRNLPALLELTILQHLDLKPGTGYAITTMTKYTLMLIGCVTAFSLLGLDWDKLQWLIAALGVGLGFGLQEIFANFISGLIILFEKPIRINDMVTIGDLTGTITKINTRATTIVDWDRKEIIVPNKAFITKQFVNWSLTDAITRIVINVPATIDADPDLIKQLLQEAAGNNSYVMANPQAEAFLVDIHLGIQIFELRVFAAEMGHRMPLRHEMHRLILEAYQKHNLELPFPPFQMRVENKNIRKADSDISSSPYKAGES